MRNLAIFGAMPAMGGTTAPLGSVVIDDVAVRCGIIHTESPAFDPEEPDGRDEVLVRVRGFSCNYRDKGFGYAMRYHPSDRFFVIGSEFVGEVVATGADVESLEPGDRVLANHHYDGLGILGGTREGVLSNQSSRELQTFPASKLVPVPETMSEQTAAGFGLNAQTAYSMVRRLAVQPGERVLVTSARSNVSLFVLAALRSIGARVFAVTTSTRHEAALNRLGVEQVIPLERGGAFFRDSAVVDEVADAIGGFDCVADPMFDAHLEKAVDLMAPFGRYVTCGLIGQNPNSRRLSGLDGKLDGTGLMTVALHKNLTLMGNCIGLTADLEAALADFRGGRFDIVIDSSFAGDDAAGFLDRSFNDPDRFGKVVFQYEG